MSCNHFKLIQLLDIEPDILTLDTSFLNTNIPLLFPKVDHNVTANEGATENSSVQSKVTSGIVTPTAVPKEGFRQNREMKRMPRHTEVSMQRPS